MFFVYIIKSEKFDWYYVGMSSDVKERLSYHNGGKVSSTKARRPYRIVHTESFKDRKDARAREKQLKNGYYKKRFVQGLI